MEVLAVLTIGVMNIVCFVIGAKVGQMSSKGETIEMPNPIEAYRRMEDRKVARMEQSRIDTIMSNIENYDGTSCGQKEVR